MVPVVHNWTNHGSSTSPTAALLTSEINRILVFWANITGMAFERRVVSNPSCCQIKQVTRLVSTVKVSTNFSQTCHPYSIDSTSSSFLSILRFILSVFKKLSL